MQELELEVIYLHAKYSYSLRHCAEPDISISLPSPNLLRRKCFNYYMTYASKKLSMQLR